MEAAVFFRNRDVVDAGFAAAHQAMLVGLPLLVAVGAVPSAGGVVPLILKTHRDAIAVERPEILDQAIILLLRPFAREKRDDRRPALKNLGAITPTAVLGIGERDAFGIARIPGILRHARLLRGSLAGERRQGWTRHDDLSVFRLPGDYRLSRGSRGPSC